MTERELDIEILKRCDVNVSKIIAGLNQVMVSCPWHDDKSPSCSISLDKHIYHCFSCGKSGSLNSLYFEKFGHSIRRDLGLPYVESVNNIFKNNSPISYEDIPETHISFTGHIVPVTSSPEALAYLKKRGITPEVAQAMKIQYAINAISKNTENLEDKKYWITISNRIVIPIYEKGKLLSIECRDTLGKEKFLKNLEEKGVDNPVYKKVLYPFTSSTSTLFQFDKLDKTKPLYFVEGLMDLGVLRTDNYFKNSTAIFGASIGGRQQYLLKKFPELIYIADHDKAGIISVYQLKKNLGREFKYMFAPKGAKDVGDIPQVLHTTVEDCRNRNWLNSMRSSDDFDIIKEAEKSEFVSAEDLDIIRQTYGGQ